MKTIDNIVVIDRDDYDELVEKATLTDEKINQRAKDISGHRDTVPVRIEFNQWRNQKNFTAPIDFSRRMETEEVYKALDEIEPRIKDWMDANLSDYGKRLKEKHITERNCIGLSKQVENLKEKTKLCRLTIRAFWIYSIVISIIAFVLSAIVFKFGNI